MVASTLCILSACGGRETNTGGSGATTGTAISKNIAMPITGRIVDVKMVGDAQGYRFEPANFTVTVGGGARFTNVSGGPHDVTFWPDSIPVGTAAQLTANMPNTTAPLTGPFLTVPNQIYVVSFAGLKPGAYHYYCTPHLALGMKGVITIQ